MFATVRKLYLLPFNQRWYALTTVRYRTSYMPDGEAPLKVADNLLTFPHLLALNFIEVQPVLIE
jgi:hypothetical protein